MNNIIGGMQKANFDTHGNNQGVIHFFEVVLKLTQVHISAELSRSIVVMVKGTEKINARIKILVVPFPLITCDLDGQLSV